MTADPVTVQLSQHHVHAIIDARVRLGLLQQLGVDFTLITDALDEIVQMCVENREPRWVDAPGLHSMHWSRHD